VWRVEDKVEDPLAEGVVNVLVVPGRFCKMLQNEKQRSFNIDSGFYAQCRKER